jgi:hypothetical protein
LGRLGSSLEEDELETQIDYLMRSLERLAESLKTIQSDQLDQNLRPSTVNITYSRKISKRKGMVVKFMMGASVRCEVPMNYEWQLAKSRVQQMQTLNWASDVENALTKEQLNYCRHDLGNCSESVPWEAMCGQPKPFQKCVILYTRTLFIQSYPTIEVIDF